MRMALQDWAIRATKGCQNGSDYSSMDVWTLRGADCAHGRVISANRCAIIDPCLKPGINLSPFVPRLSSDPQGGFITLCEWSVTTPTGRMAAWTST